MYWWFCAVAVGLCYCFIVVVFWSVFVFIWWVDVGVKFSSDSVFVEVGDAQ